MPKEKIFYSLTHKAREIYAILIENERASRSYSKHEMIPDLSDPEIFEIFLKICMENDASEDLRIFRKGLFLVLRSIGMSEASKQTKIPRTTIYRMLWKGGNPNLKYLVRVLDFLDLRPWVVTKEFSYTNRTKRFKHEMPDARDIVPGRTRRVRVPLDR